MVIEQIFPVVKNDAWTPTASYTVIASESLGVGRPLLQHQPMEHSDIIAQPALLGSIIVVIDAVTDAFTAAYAGCCDLVPNNKRLSRLRIPNKYNNS